MLANYLLPCLNDLFLGIKKAPKGAHPKVSPNRVYRQMQDSGIFCASRGSTRSTSLYVRFAFPQLTFISTFVDKP